MQGILKGLVILGIFLVSCSQMQERAPTGVAYKKPLHLIVTVHGLGGDKETWGSFAEVTKSYLDRLQPNYENRIVDFIYPTGASGNNGTSEFAQYLGRFMAQQFGGRPPGPQDKISLVCHSQGGIIAYLWMVQGILNSIPPNRLSADYAYISKLETIVTLGTPFWGSKLATITTDKRNINFIPFVKLFAGDSYKISQKEVQDLAFGSDAVHQFRAMAIQIDSDPRFYRLARELNVRLINIAGILPKNRNDVFPNKSAIKRFQGIVEKVFNAIYNFISSNPNGKRLIESDIAVITPSSRWNFIYSNTQKIPAGDLRKPFYIREQEFQMYKNFIGRSKFIPTEAVHVPFDQENTYGMAYISKACKNAQDCTHPTYRYILEELANCSAKNKCEPEAYVSSILELKKVNEQKNIINQRNAENLQTFSVQMNIKLDPYFFKTKVPVQNLRRTSNGEEDYGANNWELYEPSLLGNVIDLNYNPKTQISVASVPGVYNIHLGDEHETAAVDILGRECNMKDPYDRIKVHVTGYVEPLGQNKVEQRMYTVPITLRMPGLKPVVMHVRVQPGYSSFVELDYSTMNIGQCKPY